MLLNLTPHAFTLRTPQGDVILPPSGTVARVSMADDVVGTASGLPVIRRTPGPVVGLPTDGTP